MSNIKLEPISILTINDVDYVRKENFDRIYDTLSLVLESNVVKMAPFSGYSEVLSDAREMINNYKTVRDLK